MIKNTNLFSVIMNLDIDIDNLVNSNAQYLRAVVDDPDLYALSQELHIAFPRKGERVVHFVKNKGKSLFAEDKGVWIPTEQSELYSRDHVLYAIPKEGVTKGKRHPEVDKGGITLRFFTKELEDYESTSAFNEPTYCIDISIEKKPHVLLMPNKGIYFCQSNSDYQPYPHLTKPSFLNFDEHLFILDK